MLVDSFTEGGGSAIRTEWGGTVGHRVDTAVSPLERVKSCLSLVLVWYAGPAIRLYTG